MDLILLFVSIIAIGFGVYWYFLHVPNYHGYVTKDGKHLKKYLASDKLLELAISNSDRIWIIDVREEEYFLMGHIPNAKNYPHFKVEEWYKQIPTDKELILYCDLSIKTQKVINYLEENGHKKMLNWGKYKRWNHAVSADDTFFSESHF